MTKNLSFSSMGFFTLIITQVRLMLDTPSCQIELLSPSSYCRVQDLQFFWLFQTSWWTMQSKLVVDYQQLHLLTYHLLFQAISRRCSMLQFCQEVRRKSSSRFHEQFSHILDWRMSLCFLQFDWSIHRFVLHLPPSLSKSIQQIR